MILSCPKCSVGYKVNPQSLPEAGTYAHCNNCEYVFFVRPKIKQKEETLTKTAQEEAVEEKEPAVPEPVAQTADADDLSPESVIPEEISEDEPSENVPLEEPVSEISPDLEEGISDDIEAEAPSFEPSMEPEPVDETEPARPIEIEEDDFSEAIGSSMEDSFVPDSEPEASLSDQEFEAEGFAEIADEIGSNFDPNDFIDAMEENQPIVEETTPNSQDEPVFSFSFGESDESFDGDQTDEELLIETIHVPANPELEKTTTEINEFVETMNVEAVSEEDNLATGQWEVGKIGEVDALEPDVPITSELGEEIDPESTVDSAESDEFLDELLKEDGQSEEMASAEIDGFLDSVESGEELDISVDSVEPESEESPVSAQIDGGDAEESDVDSHAFLDSLLGDEQEAADEETVAAASEETGELDSDIGEIDLGDDDFDFDTIPEPEPSIASVDEPSGITEPQSPIESAVLDDVDALFDSPVEETVGSDSEPEKVMAPDDIDSLFNPEESVERPSAEEDGLDVIQENAETTSPATDLEDDMDLFDLAGTVELEAAGADMGESIESISDEEVMDLGDIDSIFGSTESTEALSAEPLETEEPEKTSVGINQDELDDLFGAPDEMGDEADEKTPETVSQDDIDDIFSAPSSKQAAAKEKEGGKAVPMINQDEIDSLLGDAESPGPAPGAKTDSSSGLDDIDDLFSDEPAGGSEGGGDSVPMIQQDDIDSLLGDMDMSDTMSSTNLDSSSDLGDLDDMFADSPAASGGGGGGDGDTFASENDIDELMNTSMGDIGDNIFDTEMDGEGDMGADADAMMGGDRDILEDSMMVNTSMLEAFKEGDDEESESEDNVLQSTKKPSQVEIDEEDEDPDAARRGVPEFVKKIFLSVNTFLARFSKSKEETDKEETDVDEEPIDMVLDPHNIESVDGASSGIGSKLQTLQRLKTPVAVTTVLLLVAGGVIFLTGGMEQMMGKDTDISKQNKPMTTAQRESRAANFSQYTSEDLEKIKRGEMTKAPLEGEVPEDLLASRKERVAQPMEKPEGEGQSDSQEESVPIGFSEAEAVRVAAPVRPDVKLGAILPIEFSAGATRILVVNVTLELESPATSRYISDRVPIYERILENSIEIFFSDKFYEETNYAQDKLKQFLLTELNKDKRFGRVVSVRLENFKVS